MLRSTRRRSSSYTAITISTPAKSSGSTTSGKQIFVGQRTDARLKIGDSAQNSPANKRDREQRVSARFLLAAFFPERASNQQKDQGDKQSEWGGSQMPLERETVHGECCGSGYNRADVYLETPVHSRRAIKSERGDGQEPVVSRSGPFRQGNLRTQNARREVSGNQEPAGCPDEEILLPFLQVYVGKKNSEQEGASQWY